MLDMNSEFKKYVENYDMNVIKIRLKYNHSYRVKDLSIKLAKNLKLDDENVYLASLIGLLHDIGRFEQARIYDSFVDYKTVDHADLGVKILFEDGLIRKFVADDCYDKVIYTAIKNHNKYSIEPGLDQNTLLHSKIIRDADKIDILYIQSCTDEYNFNEDGMPASSDIRKEFYENKPVDNLKVKSKTDGILRIISFLYDINYKYSYKYIYENNFLDNLYNKLQHKEVVKEYFDYMKKYLKERSE